MISTLAAIGHLAAVNGDTYIDPATGLLYGPKITHALLPEDATQLGIVPRSVIHHTNAGSSYTRLERMLAYLRRLDITGEPHGQLDLDGTLAQTMRLIVRADCNAKANRFRLGNTWYGAISWETADRGAAGLDYTPWTLEQLDTLVRIDTAVCATYDVACGDIATWTGSGLVPHNRFPEFSIYKGKTCPGAARTQQLGWIRDQVAQRLVAFHQANGSTCPGLAA